MKAALGQENEMIMGHRSHSQLKLLPSGKSVWLPGESIGRAVLPPSEASEGSGCNRTLAANATLCCD